MNFIADVWNSFLKLPLWVRVWTFLILVPVNFASLLFLDHPNSSLIIFLAVVGIVLNIIPLCIYRGFTDAMAISHVIFWIPLVVLLIMQLFFSEAVLTDHYRYFLILLLSINLISLVFDIPDTIKLIKNRNNH